MPENEDVGTSYIVISATDGYNQSVNQKISINVLNVNDRPELLSSIELPSVDQGQDIKYQLTSSHFYDKDFLVDPNEKLSFEILPDPNTKELPKFISIEKDTGVISITTDHTNVGTTLFDFRVSDSSGLYIDPVSYTHLTLPTKA